MEQALRSRRIVTPGQVVDGAVVLREGRIAAVVGADAVPAGALDLGDAVVMPGLVDSHAHLNEPGRTEWEGFDTATRAAAAGGITTIVDMPLNCIPVTTTRAALAEKRRAVAAHAHVDYAFWGGVIPGNADELDGMIEDGVVGFKAFLVHSGIDDFPAARETDLRRAMPILRARGVPLLVHAELEDEPEPAAGAGPGGDASSLRRYQTYLSSRPPGWELRAIELMIALCREHRARVHIVHLSAADALPAIEAARAEGLPLSAETCPHYLLLCAEEIPDGRTEFKCAPPIRARENAERLWRGLEAGQIELVVSDHSPCVPALKLPEEGDFLAAWGGIASLQFGLPLIWTEARRRGFGLADLARWMCEGPARLAGLEGHKGRIAPGYDADLVVWDPEATFTLEREQIRFRHPVTPYLGRRLSGVVSRTILRGQTIYEAGQPSPAPRGQECSRRDRWQTSSG